MAERRLPNTVEDEGGTPHGGERLSRKRRRCPSEELARVHPVVNEEQVDAPIESLRRLLDEKVASRKGGVPIHLASSTPPTP